MLLSVLRHPIASILPKFFAAPLMDHPPLAVGEQFGHRQQTMEHKYSPKNSEKNVSVEQQENLKVAEKAMLLNGVADIPTTSSSSVLGEI